MADINIKEYEASPVWKAKSKAILDDKDVECEICHRKRWKYLPRKKKWKRVLRFSCHHVRYDNINTPEEINDLQILCALEHKTCHEILRLRNMSSMFEEMAKIIEKYFFYEGGY